MLPVLFAGFLVSSVLLAACKNHSAPEPDSQSPSSTTKQTYRSYAVRRTAWMENSSPQPCPSGMIHIDKFCIDRFEANLMVDGEIHPHNKRPPSEESYSAVSKRGSYPQAYISREEAGRACFNSGKRLCSIQEWYRACEGSQKFLYSYGVEEVKGRCNSGKSPVFFEVFPERSSDQWTYEGHFNNPILNITPGYLSKTGEHTKCHSDEGVFDMVGNLHEWVADEVDLALQSKISLSLTVKKRIEDNYGHGIFMGGFYSTGHQHGSGCQFATIGHGVQYHDYSTGFRCCQDSSE